MSDNVWQHKCCIFVLFLVKAEVGLSTDGGGAFAANYAKQNADGLLAFSRASYGKTMFKSMIASKENALVAL